MPPHVVDERERKEGEEWGAQMEGGANNPAVSQRVAMAGWIVEEARRRCAFTEARHLKAILLPDHAPDAFAYFVSMGTLLGSTVIQRR